MIRAQQDQDERAVRQVVTAAFGDDGRVAAMAEALRRRPERGASLVATAEDQVVGLVQLSVSWIDAPDRLVEVLVLSPLAVAPAQQRHGIGSRLLAAATDEAQRLEAPLVFLEGDPAYYGNRGWRCALDLGFTPPSNRIPGPAFQVVPLPGYRPSTMRGALVYNDTFWSHDCVGLRPGP